LARLRRSHMLTDWQLGVGPVATGVATETLMGVRSALAAMALAVIAATVAAAPSNAQSYPDFESQWRNLSGSNAWDPTKPAGLAQQPPLTPEYQAIFAASLKDQAAGGRGNNFHSACVLDGMPRIMNLTAPMEILIQPTLVFFIFQDAFVRRIHTDGAAMPEDEQPSFQGYSTGKWIDVDGDGHYDALDIETTNFKGPRAMDSTGLPLHEDNRTIVEERLYLDKVNKDLLHDDITTFDHAFTRPWTVTKTYVRQHNPRWAEYGCQPPPGAVFIGLNEYRLSPDDKLEPFYEDQPPPDLRYFKARQ
jgi:hypothetical protein